MPCPDGHAALGEGEALGAVVQESDGQRQVAIQNPLPETESIQKPDDLVKILDINVNKCCFKFPLLLTL